MLIEVNCETDFVAKLIISRPLSKHGHAGGSVQTLYVCREEIPADTIEKERQILTQQALNEGKPEHIASKMVEGRIEKYYKEVCLLEQPYIRDPEISVQQVLTETIAKIGENISIRRFTRYEMGEGLQKKEDNFAEEVMAQANK